MGVTGFVITSLPPSLPRALPPTPSLPRSQLFVEGLHVPGTLWNWTYPSLPSQSPQSHGKDKRQAEQGYSGGGLSTRAQEMGPDPAPGGARTKPVLCPTGALSHPHLTHRHLGRPSHCPRLHSWKVVVPDCRLRSSLLPSSPFNSFALLPSMWESAMEEPGRAERTACARA